MSETTFIPMMTTLMSEATVSDQVIVIDKCPDQSSVRCFHRPKMVRPLFSLRELTGLSGYVIAPFSPSPDHPIWVVQDAQVQTFDTDALPSYLTSPSSYGYGSAEEKQTYTYQFMTFHRALKSGEYAKLVLSRSHVTSLSLTPEALLAAFCRAIALYPNAYISLIYLPSEGWMLGATPELLIESCGTDWHTIALAGTRQRDEDCSQWSGKNGHEQKLVTEYIEGVIRELGGHPRVEGPYTYGIGGLEHLRSDILFERSGTVPLGDLLAALHPTPAVCGLPKAQALSFIHDHEKIDRGYYSGFLGLISSDNEVQFYVNLRCLKINEDGCTFYAGGGLLPESDPESEWRETVTKMRAIGHVLSQDPISSLIE